MKKHKLNINEISNQKKMCEQGTMYYNTKYNFINQHNGLRPNKLHLFIAPTHVGKSTLTHALITDLIDKNKEMKILLYLTEETVEDFEGAISSFMREFDELNERVTVMVEDKSKSDDEIKDAIESSIMHTDYDLLVIDNITTSKLYMDRRVDTQSNISIWLKGLLEDTTLFVIAHTNGNNYNTEMLDETHIRGSKTITNITEFLYVLQPIRINDSLIQFIRIIKHRGQSPENKFFKLIYNKIQRTFSEDRISDFDNFKSTFKLRNKL